MTNDTNYARKVKITDLNQEQVKIIDQATFHGAQGTMLDLTLCTMTPVPDATMNFTYEAVISARLRFDVRMARALVEGLSKQIAMVENAQATQGSMTTVDGIRIVN